MTENQPTEDQPKTALDIEIADLKKAMDEMKQTYEAKISEYQEANKGLWARLNTVPDSSTAETLQGPVWDVDKAVKSFYNAMGIKTDNQQ